LFFIFLIISVHTHNPRDFSKDKHRKVDDIIYGGGAGMLLSPQPFYDCFESIALDPDHEVILTSPSGTRFDQTKARELSSRKQLVFLCGRYEGFDERIKSLATKQVSVGDYVLTGGELPALIMIDAISRYVPGVLGDAASLDFETHGDIDYYAELMKLEPTRAEIREFLEETGLKSLEDLRGLKLPEYPQYTRPVDFRGMMVPEILQSGNHKKIFMWRLVQAVKGVR
jgi:tRNA (guanine37-N1)-methyltransferase